MGGLFLIIPLVIVIIVGKHALDMVTPLGHNIGHTLGISSLFGKATITIISLILILFFCYLAGLMLRLGFVSNWGLKVEEKLFLFMPQLQIIKFRMTGENPNVKSAWTPILLKDDKFYVLVFVTSSIEAPVWSIYIPESPKLDSGEIRYIKKEDCEYIPITLKQAMDAVISFGKSGHIQEQLNNLK